MDRSSLDCSSRSLKWGQNVLKEREKNLKAASEEELNCYREEEDAPESGGW